MEDINCPLANNGCDIAVFLKLVPVGKQCRRGTKCMREFIPGIKRLIAKGIGVANGLAIKNPTKEEIESVQLEIVSIL